MKPLEKYIEREVCTFAKAHGMLVYKFNSESRRSVPDRIFIKPNGTVFFIEFKREGNKPTEGQAREIQRLREHNVPVWVIDNVE